jgi:hypothetical protein
VTLPQTLRCYDHGMVQNDAVARAIACFETSDDEAFLRDVLRTIRPRAEGAALRAMKQGRVAPPPREVAASALPASPKEAMATVRATRDFGLLQAMARAAGRRAEALSGEA